MDQPNNRRYEPSTMWRLPAGLSLFAIVVLPFATFISGFERGSFLHGGLVFLLALGVCAAMLGFGLGLWIALRVRRLSSVLASAFSVAVAVLWWREVFLPMIQGGNP